MKILKKSMIVIVAALSMFVHAQETENKKVLLTIEDAVALAMENNISLKSTAIDLRIKERDKNLAWNVFIPSVQGSGTLARTNMSEVVVQTPMGSRTVELEEKDRWTALGNLSIGLNLNLALFEGLKATRQNYQAGLLSWELAQTQTEQTVRKAFYGIVLQQQALSLAVEKLNTSEERLSQTRTNFQNGILPELAYLQAQLGVEMQRPQLMEARMNLEQQKALFAFLIGLPIGSVVELDGAIAPQMKTFEADALIQKHLANRIDIRQMNQTIDLMTTQIRATELQRYTPSFSINQSFAPKLSAIDDDWTNKDNWNDASGAFSITMVFNVTNILPFSVSGQKIAESRDTRTKLNLALQQTAYNAELEVRNLVKKLEKSKSSITTMEMNVTIAEKAYRLSEQGYRLGTIEYLDLKDAENTLMQAKIGVLSEKFTYISTLLDLQTALNTKL